MLGEKKAKLIKRERCSMGIYNVTLNNGEGVVLGLDSETTLKEFRKQLKDKNFKELKTIYRKGKFIVSFISYDLSEEKLKEYGLK